MDLKQKGLNKKIKIFNVRNWFYVELPKNYLIMNLKELKEFKKIINKAIKEKSNNEGNENE